MQAWYVAKTKTGKERWLETYLRQNCGVEVFVPIIRRPTGKGSFEPLFPGYIFCLVDPEYPHWPAVRWAPGLAYFLGVNREPAPISSEVIDHLKQRISWWNNEGHSPRFAPGQHLVVVNGPFAGLDGIFQRYVPARERCQVLLKLVGRMTRVELPYEAIGAEFPYRAFAVRP